MTRTLESELKLCEAATASDAERQSLLGTFPNAVRRSRMSETERFSFDRFCNACTPIEEWHRSAIAGYPAALRAFRALIELQSSWRKQAWDSKAESERIRRMIKAATDAEERCLVRTEMWDKCEKELDAVIDQFLAELNASGEGGNG